MEQEIAPPDLVLTDVFMPGMSGTAMGELLRRSRPGLKVLYMSGYPDDTIAPHGALATQTFDVFLVDLNIPGTSGEQVLREIRGAGYAAPAIVLTGDVATADMNVLRPLGVVSVVAKSSNAQPLLQAIGAAGAPDVS